MEFEGGGGVGGQNVFLKKEKGHISWPDVTIKQKDISKKPIGQNRRKKLEYEK